MGAEASEEASYEKRNSQMVIDEYDYSDDPDFDIEKYCREYEHLDPVDIINIRQAFLNLRDPENDPVETVRTRKLRLFPFLTPDDIVLLQSNAFDENGGITLNKK
jgi:hypothetical protein